MDKIRNIKILVLEDDLETLEFVLRILKEVSIEKEVAIGVTALPDYVQTELFINRNPDLKYDILLLDRDCFLGGTFHVVNLENFDKEKAISISSVPEYNEEARKMGIKRVVLKDYQNLEEFSAKLKSQLLELV